jgi:carboxylesterase type B
VQKYIHLFGGDPNDITLMGESAGANSIMLHITSYGGTGVIPFQKAIMQSPAWRPASTAAFYQDLYEQVLQLANATSYDQIRTMNSTALENINNAIIAVAPYASFGFGTTYFPCIYIIHHSLTHRRLEHRRRLRPRSTDLAFVSRKIPRKCLADGSS